MQKELTIALIQTNLVWQNVEANLLEFESKFFELEKSTDVAVLPEMFTTGFSMTPDKYADKWPGKTLQWMLHHSKLYDIAICGSIMVEIDSKFYNRFIWTQPDGQMFVYDKRHLFRMGGEHNVYAAGEEKIQIEFRGWKIAPFVCYDLRFPVWSRNLVQYDLALYVANWPAARAMVWRKLLMARAIENQCFVVGVNRVGIDGNGLYYTGNSMMIDARGDIMAECAADVIETRTVILNKTVLEVFREKFPVFLDADDFNIELKK